MSTETLYSQHSFLFPFKWDIGNKTNTYDKRTNLNDLFNELKENGNWDYYRFEPDGIETAQNYNEYEYFYSYVRNSLYNYDDKVSNETVSIYYEHKEYKKEKKKKYVINTGGESYNLFITSITLRLFETGVGVLSFHLDNILYSEFKDILKINDFGRRLYPAYKLEDGQKGYTCANSISIGDNINIDFNVNTKNKLEPLERIFGSNFHYNNNKSSKSKNDIYFKEILDDRMYTLCWYMNNDLIEQLKQMNDYEEYQYLNNDDWSKYVFIDGEGITCKSSIMKKNLLEKASYPRWIGDKTIFGVSRYSFVLLTNNSDFAKNVLSIHMKTMYYQMAVLSLVQRASILRFSQEVSYISKMEEKENNLVQDVRSLYKNYIQFVNRIYFREVTAQEQGIELYNMLLESMNTERDIKDLDREIEELHNYATLINQEEEGNKINNLTKRGFPLVISSYIVGLLGSNFFEATNFKKPEALIKSVFMTLVIGIVIFLISNFIYNFFINKGGKNGKTRG